jgi:hypothetical protein
MKKQEARRAEASFRMEPNNAVVFDALPYIESLSSGEVRESLYTPRKKNTSAKEVQLQERISYLKDQARVKDKLLAEYEKVNPLKRSIAVSDKAHVGYVITRRGTRKKITL